MSYRSAAVLLILWCVACSSTAPRTAEVPEISAGPSVDRLVMVILPPGPPQVWNRVGDELAEIYGLETIHRWPMASLNEHCIVYSIPEGRTPAELARRLAADPRVASAQPVYRFEVSGEYNDPYSELQHGAKTLNLEAAHRWATGKGVRVAIIDTGVDVSHPDLEGRVIQASNFVVDVADETFTTDVHGTAVAGVIAAGANNGIGIVGVAPDAHLLALKACWQDPPDSKEAVCDSYTLAKAFDAALQARPQILNLSLAGPKDPLLTRMIHRAIELGIVVVAAAGSAAELAFPASLEDVIGIRSSSAGVDGAHPDVAPHGSGSLAAPGVDILTTIPRGAYDFLSGSSFAAAHVTGFAALLLERDPDLTPSELAALLRGTARSSDANLADGSGVLDGCAALGKVLGDEGAALSSLSSPAEMR